MTTIVVRAADSTQAMEEIQRRLGDEAYILSTRTLNGQVEIRATSEAPGPRLPVPDFTRALDARLDGTGLRASFDRVSGAERAPRSGLSLTAGAVGEGADLVAVENQLTRDLLPAGPALDLIGAPPPRLVLFGPAGSGKSFLAARIAAAMMRRGRNIRPRLIQPVTRPCLAEDRLRGWARLMGLAVDRPMLGQLAQSPDWIPDDESAPQIVDMSEVADVKPEDVAELIAAPGAQAVLVLPAGLSARRIAALVAPWSWLSPTIALTGLDMATPEPEPLLALAAAGFRLSLLAEGPNILDSLRRPVVNDLRRWAEDWWRQGLSPAAMPAPVAPAAAPATLAQPSLPPAPVAANSAGTIPAALKFKAMPRLGAASAETAPLAVPTFHSKRQEIA